MKMKAIFIIVLISLIFTGCRSCCNSDCIYTATVKPNNDAEANLTISCPEGGGSLYQSFLAFNSVINSIAIQLRAGGSFPTTGYTTHIKLRNCSINGTILAESSAFVPGPLITGKMLYVTFTLPEPVQIPIGKRIIIEWISPPEGGVIFGWTRSKGNTYPDGSAFSCNGTLIPDEDFIFKVLPLD